MSKDERKRPGFPARMDHLSVPAVSRPASPRLSTPVPTAVLPSHGPVPTAVAAPSALDALPMRRAMVHKLQAQGLRNPGVINAMQQVPRHAFVDTGLAAQAYEDTSLPIGLEQTISKPSVVARQLELMLGEHAKLTGRLLEIGTGCGYQAALLAHLADEVYSIERLRGMHDKAIVNLRPFRIRNVHLILGDGMLGYPKGGPYAGIVSAAGGEQLPSAWLEQLAVGGRLVAPVAMDGKQRLVVIERTATGYERTVHESVKFVPLKSGLA